MGLDMYLYRTSKRRVKASSAFNDVCKEYSRDVDALMNKPRWKELMDSLPKDEYGHSDRKSYTKEQKNKLCNLRRAVRRVAKRHGLNLDGGLRPIFDENKYGLTDKDTLEEIGYWRKEWNLHKYLIDNFWHDKENNNLVDVFLTKDNLKKIVKDIGGDAFKAALERWDDDYVVFYHPWY